MLASLVLGRALRHFVTIPGTMSEAILKGKGEWLDKIMHLYIYVSKCTVNRKIFVVKIFSDSMGQRSPQHTVSLDNFKGIKFLYFTHQH